MGIHFHRECFAFISADTDTQVGGTAVDRHNTFDRTKHIHQRSNVIRPHIEERTAAFFVVECGGGMPAFVTGADHKSGTAHDFSDFAAVDELTALLVTGSEKRIRSATGTQTFFRRQSQNFKPVLPVQGKRFFRIDMFARFQCTQIDFFVSFGNRQVQNKFDFRII